jgi:hypothetical protein
MKNIPRRGFCPALGGLCQQFNLLVVKKMKNTRRQQSSQPILTDNPEPSYIARNLV